MNMKRLLTLVAFFATVQASAQQVNPVPDYVFANRMSAGRNTVTDTAAYFSIGPRYGATRGMMPPMVVDTASFSANKRNGLLIFSVQKNKFLYWDSVGVKWAEMAGTSGTALTSADTAALLSTRAWRQKGIDSLAAIRIAGSGTINRVPKFTGSGEIGNGSISDSSTSVQMTILSTGNIGIGTASPLSKLHIVGTGQTLTVNSNNAAISIKNSTKEYFHQVVDANNRFRIFDNTASLERITLLTNGDVGISAASPLYRFHTETVNSTAYTPSNTLTSGAIAYFYNNTDANATVASTIRLDAGNLTGNCATTISAIRTGNADAALTFGTRSVGSSVTERVRIAADGEFFINTTTDAGDYKLQISGNIYNTGSITTGAPSGGSIKPWKIGEAATVSPTSPNRTLRVEIDGVVYYIHAKTTND